MYSCYFISNKPHLFDSVVKSLSPERISYFDGSGFNSFSQLVNSCVSNCYTETIIVMSDKVQPKQEHVIKTVELLEKGYAFVALYRFAFFGFKKELMRKIGMMDERYVGGGFEDDDFYIRLIENNLAMYVTHDVPYTAGNSSWNPEIARQHFYSKWNFDYNRGILKRQLSEPKLNYDLGSSVPTNFLPCKEYSYAPLPQVGRYFTFKFESTI